MRRTGAIVIMLLAATLEVGGDALIRGGLRGGNLALAAAGAAVLAFYGVSLVQLRIDFSSLLGAYVGVFALAGVVFGMLFFGEHPPPSTWLGLAIILAGSAVIQLGPGIR